MLFGAGMSSCLSASPVAAVWYFQDVSEQHLPRNIPASKHKPGCFLAGGALSGLVSHLCRAEGQKWELFFTIGSLGCSQVI